MNTLLLFFTGLAVGIVLLGWAANRFIGASISIANQFKLPPLIIGLVLVGFGTSFPELVVSALAAVRNEASLAIGNVIGSNIANIGLCLGVTALLTPLIVRSRILKREYLILLLITIATGVIAFTGTLNRIDGVILLVILALYLSWIFKTHTKNKADALTNDVKKEMAAADMRLPTAIVWWVISLALIFISSEILIRSAVAMAQWFHVSSLLIGLTILAVGTSLPELAATIIAAQRGEADIAIGNVLGSCIFNLSAVLAMPALIAPSKLASEILHRDYPILLGFTALFWLLTVMPPRKGQLGRVSGIVFLAAFVSYIVLLIAMK